MLISREGHKIWSINISPIPSWWDCFDINIFKWLFGFNKRWHIFWRFSLTCSFSQKWFWLTNTWWSGISYVICPSINWYSPLAWWFYSQIVSASNNLEETLLTPVRSPWISTNPIRSSIVWYTPTNNWDIVINIHVTSSIIENTSSIVKESLSYSHSTDNWSTLIDFIHHSCFTRNLTVFTNTIDFSISLCPTSRWRSTVFAFNFSCAS